MPFSILRRGFDVHGGLLVAWVLLVAGSAHSQEPPALNLRPIPDPAANGALIKPTANPVVRGPCDPDYWIVSARHCNERLECGLDCQYQVVRFDGPGPGRPGNLQDLYASLEPGVPVCIMVHGSFVLWQSVLRDSAGTYRWLRNAAPARPVKMIFFSWPSDEAPNLLPHAVDTADARRLGCRAELNSLYLADLISHVPDSSPISLIGHSHGARMVSATMHLLAGGMVRGRCFKGGPYHRQRIRAVLAAAAMDHDWFNPGERYDRALCRAEAVLNVRNRLDLPLLFHPTHQLFASRALGRAGITMSDQRWLGFRGGFAAQTGQILDPQSTADFPFPINRGSDPFVGHSPVLCRIVECDVTSLIGCRHVWPNYYNEPEIASSMRRFVYFDEK